MHSSYLLKQGPAGAWKKRHVSLMAGGTSLEIREAEFGSVLSIIEFSISGPSVVINPIGLKNPKPFSFTVTTGDTSRALAASNEEHRIAWVNALGPQTACDSCTLEELVRRIESRNDKSVIAAKMKIAMAALFEDGTNLDAGVFFSVGLDNFVTDSRRSEEFFVGQGVLLTCPGLANPQLGVVRFKTPGASTAAAVYSIEIPTMHGVEAVEHADVSAGFLQLAVGGDFDVAKETQQTDFLESLGERVGPDPGGRALEGRGRQAHDMYRKVGTHR